MKGHIRERSPGHWAIVLDAKDPIAGKRTRRWHSFRGTKREAQIECARVLLERLRGKPLYLLASLGLGTGLRRNEMLGLRWGDTDLDAGRLTIEQSLEQTRTHGIRVKGPKTKHGRRTISLPAHLVTELRQHWREQQEQRLGMGLGKAPDSAPVFATVDGRHLSPNAITKAWPVAMAAIGMPAVTLHSLRHTHASMLIASGIDILTISRRLGHSSPTITLSVYGHLIHGTDDRAAQIMDKAFGSKMVANACTSTRERNDGQDHQDQS
jgi:integrase